MSDDIIEAATRALRDANIYDAPVWKTYHQMADVMLAAVELLIRNAALEEAIKAIESAPYADTRDEAIDALRALKEQP